MQREDNKAAQRAKLLRYVMDVTKKSVLSLIYDFLYITYKSISWKIELV